MAATSSQRDGGGGVRYAALSIGVNGDGGGDALSTAAASKLPSSPLSRRQAAAASSSSSSAAAAASREINGFFDKEPLLPLSYKDASSGDLHGHYKRVTSVHHRVGNSLGLSRTFVAGSAYCMASTSMVLLNKAALSSFGFGSPTALLLFQCTVCTCAAAAAGALGLSRLEWPTARLARAWAPVSVLFVGMVWSSVFALRDLGVPMVTVLKNLTNLFTICGDYALFGRVYGRRVWATLALMALSALCGAATDLEFSAAGYGWQIANCAFTSAYSLALRLLMERGGDGVLWGGGGGSGGSGGGGSTSDSIAAAAANPPSPPRRLNELSMVFYNNALSLPLIALLAWARGDLGRVSSEPALSDPRFLAAAGASAALAFGISFTSLWFLSTTTATTFSLVGSLNKVPVAAVGLVAFGVPATAQNVAAIAVGLVASAVFVWAKQGDSGNSSSNSSNNSSSRSNRRGSSNSNSNSNGGGVGGFGLGGNAKMMMHGFFDDGGGVGGGGGDRESGGSIGTSVVVVGGSGSGGGGSPGSGGVGGGSNDEAPGSGSKALRR